MKFDVVLQGAVTILFIASSVNAAPGWYIETDGYVLNRSDPDSVIVGGKRNNYTFSEVFSTDDVSDLHGAGYSVTIGRKFQHNSIEGTYFSTDNDGSASFSDEAEHINPGFNPGGYGQEFWFIGDSAFTWAPQYDLNFSSSLDSVELNSIFPLSEDVDLLLGFRYLKFSESIGLSSIDPIRPGMTDIGTIAINADNNLFGAQVGVEAQKALGANWTLAGYAKAGLYANKAEKSLSHSNDSAWWPASFSHNDDTTQLAYSLEASINFVLHMSEKLDFSLGYFALYLDGVAGAVEYFPLANTEEEFTKFSADHDVFYHGAKIGLTYSF